MDSNDKDYLTLTSGIGTYFHRYQGYFKHHDGTRWIAYTDALSEDQKELLICSFQSLNIFDSLISLTFDDDCTTLRPQTWFGKWIYRTSIGGDIILNVILCLFPPDRGVPAGGFSLCTTEVAIRPTYSSRVSKSRNVLEKYNVNYLPIMGLGTKIVDIVKKISMLKKMHNVLT